MEPRSLPLPQLLDRSARRPRIGLLALSTDLVIDRVFQDICGGLPVDVFINRVRFDNPVSIETLARLADDLDRATTDLLSGETLEVVAFGCSSGTAAIGEGPLAAKIQKTKPKARVTNPITAASAAFAALSARRISVLTPYSQSVNREIAAFFIGKGLELLSISGLGVEDDRDIARISPDAIRKAANEALAPGSEALFLSCTALRAAELAEELEASLGLPVVTSNQALIWHALRLAEIEQAVEGYGRLLTLPSAPLAAA